MNNPASLKKFTLLILLSTVLSLVASFLATPILRVVRNVYGAKFFWGSGAVIFLGIIALKLFPLALLVGSCWLVVGIYSEFEERGLGNFWTATLAITLSTLLLIGGSVIADRVFGSDFIGDIQKTLESLLAQMQIPGKDAPTTFAGMKIDAAFLMSQVPSVLFVLGMINLAFALMMDRKFALLFGLRFERIALHLQPLEFRTPDIFVWLTMAAFLGAFLRLNNPPLQLAASNVFTIMMGFYFFQGMAVMETALTIFRTGPFMRFLLYFIVVGQLFFVLSAVGFADYWLDFRRRLRNIRSKEKKSNSEEHI